MRVVLRKPECNHIAFSRKVPDNAIMKIADGYMCQHTVQGSWWLVKGPEQKSN